MIKNRNIALCIVLSIVTCGIYTIYWMITMANDVNTVSDRNDDTNGAVVFLLSAVTCSIYLLYWMYKTGEKLEYAQQKRNLPSSNNGVVYLVLTLFGFRIISYCLIQAELNKMADIPA
ncbi:MAG: DUF4234 domain-containing protein [Ruminococcus sp.]|nr:DUF4234 domain-containing protein [Ruminococcus sp.]